MQRSPLPSKVSRMAWSSMLIVLVVLGGRWLLLQAYPMDHLEMIQRHALAQQIEPMLVAAVIRNESHFDPKAMSPQGARGLMQIMPETGQWIAHQMQLSYSDDMLWNPEYNITLGCWYLDNLNEEFHGDLVLVLASYNAGRSNVKRWLDQKQWTGEQATLRQVPFTETRTYVAKVLRDVKIYRLIYGRTATR